MGKETSIEWCDATWNPWRGCKPCSIACGTCYALRAMKRWKLGTEVRMQGTYAQPLEWKCARKPMPARSRIFVCSWSDFFIADAISDTYRPAAWAIMRQCPEWDFLILTKRPERMAACMPPDWGPTGYPNVWLGVTVEDATYRGRIDYLLDIPAPVHFVSVEPMLGPVKLANFMRWQGDPQINWVICGGQTGPGAVPMDPDWAFGLLAECEKYGVPFFFKSWGEKDPPHAPSLPASWNSGRWLGGCERNGFPR